VLDYFVNVATDICQQLNIPERADTIDAANDLFIVLTSAFEHVLIA
jgi:hypothetical protein